MTQNDESAKTQNDQSVAPQSRSSIYTNPRLRQSLSAPPLIPLSRKNSITGPEFDLFANHVPVQKTLQMVYKRSVEAAVTLKSASNTLLLMKKAVQDHISLYKPEEYNENFESFLGVVENISEFAASMSKKGQEIEENFDNAFISSRKADNRAKLCILEQNIKAYKAASKNLKSQMNRCSKLEKEVNPHRLLDYINDSERLFENQKNEISSKVKKYKNDEITLWTEKLDRLSNNFSKYDQEILNTLRVGSLSEFTNSQPVQPSKSADVVTLRDRIETISRKNSMTLKYNPNNATVSRVKRSSSQSKMNFASISKPETNGNRQSVNELNSKLMKFKSSHVESDLNECEIASNSERNISKKSSDSARNISISSDDNANNDRGMIRPTSTRYSEIQPVPSASYPSRKSSQNFASYIPPHNKLRNSAIDSNMLRSNSLQSFAPKPLVESSGEARSLTVEDQQLEKRKSELNTELQNLDLSEVSFSKDLEASDSISSMVSSKCRGNLPKGNSEAEKFLKNIGIQSHNIDCPLVIDELDDIKENEVDESIGAKNDEPGFHESFITQSFNENSMMLDKETNRMLSPKDPSKDPVDDQEDQQSPKPELLEVELGHTVKYMPSSETNGWIWGNLKGTEKNGWFPKYCIQQDNQYSINDEINN